MKAVELKLITKDQLKKFIEVRNSGIVNMANYKDVAILTGLSPETCYTIMCHFRNLCHKFNI